MSTLSVDQIIERTPGSGVTVSGLLIRDGRVQSGDAVFYPTAVGDGVTDASVTLAADIANAIALGTSGAAAGRPFLDLRGNCYALGSQVEIGAVPIGGLRIGNGRLVALPTFSTSAYLLNTGTLGTAGGDGFKIHDLQIDELYLDCNARGGGIQLHSYNRVRVSRCEFVHYTSIGLRVGTGSGSGHEAKVDNCQFGEYWWGEAGYNAPNSFVGTACEVNAPDNHFSVNVMQLSRCGLKLNSKYNAVSQLHMWMGHDDTVPMFNIGLHMTSLSSFNTLSQLYVDGCEILWENPWHTTIADSQFLIDTTNTAFSFVRLKTMGTGIFVTGMKLHHCSFQVTGTAAGSVNAFAVDTALGAFSSVNIKESYIADNSANGCKVHGTHARRSGTLAAASSVSVDFTDYLFNFGATRPLSVCLDSATLATAQVTAKSGTGNVVFTVTTSVAVTGVVWVTATMLSP